ncbi:thioredoxin family protein [uncultured Rikenella sp.]|uniref:thioredoxin family protein n=1 Tax=uncultured Rikenella sp. TaxID=368003 RepID=UPI0025CFF0EF|nr:thioredoxin family protein [uncultured Rikenella sp.]
MRPPKILLLLLLPLLLHPAAGKETGRQARLTYHGSDPYTALNEARSQGKLLLVEFYADWNHRSRWMSEHVLSDSAVRLLIESRFIPVQVPTGTTQGAELARLYEVTSYPAILIFHPSGDVLDKVDVTLDPADFEQRLRALLMTTQGYGTWRLRRIYTAAESGDPVATDAAVRDFLHGQLPQDLANSVIWPLFENSIVLRSDSPAFDYLTTHIETFRQAIGRETVDAVLDETLRSGMLPYVVGSRPYSTPATAALVETARRLDLSSLQSLESMADVAALRQSDDLDLFTARVGLLMAMLPEPYSLPLALSLEPVALRGSRDTRKAARELVDELLNRLRSPAQIEMLHSLRERLE